NRKKAGRLGSLGPAEAPLEIIHVDTVGGFQGFGSNKRYLHLAICAFSRYVWATMSRTQKAMDFIGLINKICDISVPKIVVCDRYTGLRAKEFQRFLKKKGITLIYTPADHPQSNGIVERVNATLMERLRCKEYV